jgi:uncharacterized protein (DUF2235 family)
VPVGKDDAWREVMGKNIVLLSDGTGNSAAKLFKTNVWRLYQALDLTPGSDQVAFYDDGVGTSNFRPLALLGGAVGYGLARNVKQLYFFLCENYEPGDHIYAFGFSRGAFTIRVLIGMLGTQGVIPGRPMQPDALRREVDKAYARDRQDYITNWSRIFGRGKKSNGAITTQSIPKIPAGHLPVPIEFVGVWDTVAAYGLPVDELQRGIDYWWGGFSFPDQDLSPIVQRACHAISLDDQRRTFHPVLWNEQNAPPGQITQVWFAGMHSNVGGGYAKDGLAWVSLQWMVNEAKQANLACPLKFHNAALDEIDRLAYLHDEMGNSRAGFAAYYRYDPRRVRALCNDDYNKVWIAHPKIHHSALDRIKGKHIDYAPHVIPAAYDVVDASGAVAASPYETPTQARQREEDLERAWDLVWWRRIAYFITLFLTGYLAVFPWLCAAETTKACTGIFCVLEPFLIATATFLPAWADTWIDPFRRNIGPFVLLVALLSLAMMFGKWLERRIAACSAEAWAHVTGTALKKGDVWGPLSMSARMLRTSEPLVKAYRIFARHVLPFGFFLATVLLGLFLANRVVFYVIGMAGSTCIASDQPKSVGDVPTPADRLFETDDPCFDTGIRLKAGETYTMSFSVQSPWMDGSKATSPAGFTGCDARWTFTCRAPMRRYFTAKWFEPIARVGQTGLDRYRLHPRCAKPDCSDQVYVSPPFTVRNSGELFLFVNDAVYGLPGLWSRSYRNNRGTAQITITRVPPENVR